jgi:nitrogen fixation NifU-like protein
MEFNDLYQEIILDHYKNPRNFGEGKPYCTAVELDNPVCGDHIKLTLEVDDENVVRDVKFSGSGCAISVASASMMTQELKGKTLDEANRIIADILLIMRGEKDADALEAHGDVSALKGVLKFPVRVKCATLSWHAAQDAIKKYEDKKK